MLKKTVRTAAIAGAFVFVSPFSPFTDSTVSAQEEDGGDDDEDEENSTPAPSEVNTGDAVPGDDDTMLVVTAGALTVLAGGAFALRRRSLA